MKTPTAVTLAVFLLTNGLACGDGVAVPKPTGPKPNGAQGTKESNGTNGTKKPGEDEKSAQPAAARAKSLPLLTELKTLTHREGGDMRVDLTATCTYWDRSQFQTYIQDGDKPIFVRLTHEMHERLSSPVGHLVHVQGRLSENRKVIIADTFEVLAKVAKRNVKPLQVNVARLPMAGHWARLVALDAHVRRMHIGDNHADLDVESHGRQFRVYLNASPPPQKLSEWLGAQIHVVGVMDYVTNADGMRRIIRAVPQNIKVAKPSTQEVPTRITPLSQLTSASPAVCRTSGQVTYRFQDQLLLEQPQPNGPPASCTFRAPHWDVLPGAFVEVVLRPINSGPGSHRPNYEAIGMVVQRASSVGPAIRATAEEVTNGLSNQRVELVGQLRNFQAREALHRLECVSNGIPFTALLIASDKELEELDLHSANCIRLSGVVQNQQVGKLGAFIIAVNSADDITVLDRWMLVQPNNILLAGGGICAAGLLVLVWLSTLRRQVRRKTESLENLTAHLNTSFDTIREGLLIVDPNGQVVRTNRALKGSLDIASESPQDLDTLTREIANHFEKRDDLLHLLSHPAAAQGRIHEFSRKAEAGGGTWLIQVDPIRESDGTQNGWLWTFDDVTETRLLQQQLLQSQKMEAVGRLAGGIAHDFNNLLLGISANLETALMYPDKPVSLIQTQLDLAQQAADRAAHLVEDLLGFSRQVQLRLARTEVAEVVDKSVALLRPSIPTNIDLTLDLTRGLACMLDENHMVQVLLNLAFNAIDAMPLGGKLAISVYSQTASSPASDADMLGGREQDGVVIEISDTGTGIPTELHDAVFDPFFTTKEHGRGTGLGLASARGVVQQQAGTIEFSSEPDVGTTFYIWLPRAENADSAAEKREPAPLKQVALADPMRILFADDDDLVRRSGTRLLTAIGNDVTAVSNGLEAIQALKNDDQYDVVLLDLSMPVMSGGEAFAEIRKLHPALPIVICSGHLFDFDDFQRETGEEPCGFLAKPFKAETLEEALHAATDANSSMQLGCRRGLPR